MIPIGSGALGTIPKGLVKRLERFQIRGYSDHSEYSITKKIPGNLRRLTVTQTPSKNHQLTLI